MGLSGILENILNKADTIWNMRHTFLYAVKGLISPCVIDKSAD